METDPSHLISEHPFVLYLIGGGIILLMSIIGGYVLWRREKRNKGRSR